MATKSAWLQIRVSPTQKAALRRLARGAGQDLSAWVLARALPGGRVRFHELIRDLGAAANPRFALAELADLLVPMTPTEFGDATATVPDSLRTLDPFLQNYLAATVEHLAAIKSRPAPAWTAAVPPVETPWFATGLPALRLHLLRSAPVAFRRRNLFPDTVADGRV